MKQALGFFELFGGVGGTREGPADEGLESVVLRQAESIVEGGGGHVSFHGPLPELAAVVGAGEHGAVFLALVAEDGEAFSFEFIGR